MINGECVAIRRSLLQAVNSRFPTVGFAARTNLEKRSRIEKTIAVAVRSVDPSSCT